MNNVQLFLLPFAGGNCYSYNFLRKDVQNLTLDLYNLELPGRGKRRKEAFSANHQMAVDDYCKQIKELRNGRPYIIYGHSMGADLAFWVTNEMETAGDPPSDLVVTGCPSPIIKTKLQALFMVKTHKMNDTKLKIKLKSMEAVPDRILSDEKLFNAISPVLRNDFRLVESDYDTRKKCVINTPIYALMGNRENYAEQIDLWQNFTKGDMVSLLFDGGHFFIHDYVHELVKVFKFCIEKN